MSGAGKSFPAGAPPHAAWPWATATILGAAIVVTAWPAAAAALELERDRVMAGELWRWWTAHLAHFGWSHAGWNMLVLALTGGWAERLAPARTRFLYVVAPPMIALAVLGFEPALQRYAGLSGIAAATTALLALSQLGASEAGERWFWRTAILVLLAKIGLEFGSGRPVFAHFAGTDIRTVPIAHLAGVVGAACVHLRPAVASRGEPAFGE